MPENPKYAETFINHILKPWEELAPDAEFADLTFEDFKKVVKPSLEARADIETLETQLIAARQKRNNADAASVAACLQMVNGVRSGSKYGPNSPLYRAMGYVADNERKSGLVRPSANQRETGKPVASDAPAEPEKKVA